MLTSGLRYRYVLSYFDRSSSRIDMFTTYDDLDDFTVYPNLFMDQWLNIPSSPHFAPAPLDIEFPDSNLQEPHAHYEAGVAGPIANFAWNPELSISHPIFSEEGSISSSLLNQQELRDQSLRRNDQVAEVARSDKLDPGTTGRQWEDSIIVFPIDSKPSARSRIRRRKKFPADRKKEVA